MNFNQCDFQQAGPFVVTNTNYSVFGQSLRNAKLLLIDRGAVVDIDYVRSGYNRASVYILPPDATFDEPGKAGITKLINGRLSFTVNQNVIHENERLLQIGGTKGETPLVDKFKKYVNSLTDNDVKEELLSVNIDMPEYGVIGDQLFLINKPDQSISRMIIFEKFTHRGKVRNSISIYYFGENLYSMTEHVLNRYVLIFDGSIQVSVSLDENFNIQADNDTTLALPLKKTNYRNYNMRDVQKLFKRKSFVDSMVKVKK
jgi:hypothetical protein